MNTTEIMAVLQSTPSAFVGAVAVLMVVVKMLTRSGYSINLEIKPNRGPPSKKRK